MSKRWRNDQHLSSDNIKCLIEELNGRTANNAIRVDASRGATVRILSKGMEVKFFKDIRQRGRRHLHYIWNTLIYGQKKKRYVHSVVTVLSWSGPDGAQVVHKKPMSRAL